MREETVKELAEVSLKKLNSFLNINLDALSHRLGFEDGYKIAAQQKEISEENANKDLSDKELLK